MTLLIGAVNENNGISRSVVTRWKRQYIANPPLGKDPERSWPHPKGAYLPNPERDDVSSQNNPIHVVLSYYTQRLGPMPKT